MTRHPAVWARAVSVLAIVAAIATPVAIGAWGMDVHRLITARVVDALPADLRPILLPRRAFIIEHAVDPDLWRVVGLKGDLGAEDPNHYLDIDALDEPAPYTGVPRDWTAFVRRYGVERANRVGRLPWRVSEMYDRLVIAFRDVRRGSSAYGADNAGYVAAVMAHYVEDAFVPFHAVENHDGQLTGQTGIHARFETALVLRNSARLSLRPVHVSPVADPKIFIFDTLARSASLVPDILAADRRALAGRHEYDDAYFAAFFVSVRPVLERRLSDAADGVASLIAAAWTDAGR